MVALDTSICCLRSTPTAPALVVFTVSQPVDKSVAATHAARNLSHGGQSDRTAAICKAASRCPPVRTPASCESAASYARKSDGCRRRVRRRASPTRQPFRKRKAGLPGCALPVLEIVANRERGQFAGTSFVDCLRHTPRMKLPAACHTAHLRGPHGRHHAFLARRVPTAEPGGEIDLLWPDGHTGGGARDRARRLSERAPDGPLRDRIAEHVTRPLLTLFHATRHTQRHHPAHRPRRRLCARGHRQGRFRGGRVVHRSAASTARCCAIECRPTAGPRAPTRRCTTRCARCACCAAAPAHARPGRRRASASSDSPRAGTWSRD